MTRISPGIISPASATAKRTILIVDDEPMIRYVLRAHLADSGYAVLEAGTGAEALDLYELHGHAIDAVILDLHMPGLSGEECYARLRRIDPQVRVIVSTGSSVEYKPDTQALQGVAAIVEKPFKLADFKQLLDGILSR
ncbi:MAG: response regulator [Planctomycetota bacterium]|jgi:CheY-like chemotaxis protein